MINLSFSRLAFFLTAYLFFVGPKLHAGSSNKNGNPFGNGTFFNNSGTFSGVIRGENLAGITQFTTTSSSTNTLATSQGATFVYIEGVAFSSGVAATYNPSAGTLSAFFSTESQTGGGSALQGGGFLGTLANSYPNQTFNGTGSVTDDLGYIHSISVNGARISQ